MAARKKAARKSSAKKSAGRKKSASRKKGSAKKAARKSARKKAPKRKARRRGASLADRTRDVVEGNLKELERQLPKNLGKLVRDLRGNLKDLEKQIDKARKDREARWDKVEKQIRKDTGKVFQITARTLKSWREWIQTIRRDQFVLWAPACMLGMLLPAMVSYEFIRGVENISGNAAAAMIAEGVAARHGQIFWFLTLLCGFLILAPSQVTLIASPWYLPAR